mmetsp:Transcript_4455/g.8419  ORF Transcript_4455/g.8419 Transcript_4455/m.8419 type:complete len:137 (+) Transcript_4455:67-477(+)
MSMLVRESESVFIMVHAQLSDLRAWNLHVSLLSVLGFEAFFNDGLMALLRIVAVLEHLLVVLLDSLNGGEHPLTQVGFLISSTRQEAFAHDSGHRVEFMPPISVEEAGHKTSIGWTEHTGVRRISVSKHTKAVHKG